MRKINYLKVIDPINESKILTLKGKYFYHIKEYKDDFMITFHKTEDKFPHSDNELLGFVLHSTTIKKREIIESGLKLNDWLKEYLNDFMIHCENIFIEEKQKSYSEFQVLLEYVSNKTF